MQSQLCGLGRSRDVGGVDVGSERSPVPTAPIVVFLVCPLKLFRPQRESATKYGHGFGDVPCAFQRANKGDHVATQNFETIHLHRSPLQTVSEMDREPTPFSAL